MPFSLGNLRLKRNSIKKLLFLSLMVICFSLAVIPLSQQRLNAKPILDSQNQPISSDSNPLLFEGTENALNITDYGNLYKTEQYVEVTNQEAINLTYYLDDVHNWEVSKAETQINNIQDERDWVDNGVIGSDTGLTPTSQVSQYEDSGPNYGKNLNPSNYMATFDGNDCDYMRIHFVLLEVEYYYDELYISNQDNTVLDNFAGYYTNFYTPWYSATELKISIDSDVSVELYGYSVDFFETYNGSMFTLDSTSWNYFEATINDPSRLYGGTAEIGNRSALRTVIEGIDSAPSYSYEDGDIAGFYQNITIPRGELIDAWVSMDYNVLRGINTNDNYAYIKLNGEPVYTRGFRTITNAGLGQWHSTGLINLDLWENSSSIFDEVLIGQSINLSVGIEIANGVQYTGFDHLDIQEAYFDNIQLILKTSANSTQSGINLQFNNSILNDDNTWGVSYLNLTGNWNNNPLKLTVTTDSPSLSFDLDTTLYGHHKTKSRVGQTTLEGVSYEILKNGTILWEFSHNLYMPAQYSDFEFIIDKPENWNFISVLDPTLQSRPYDYGSEGDLILHISKDNALFPGWWTFRATSPNYLSSSNTKLLKEGEWTDTTFTTGESTMIKTQVNFSNEIPTNLGSTEVNLSIYDPDGLMWFSETQTPLSNGSVFFSELYFDALNTTGGQYDYTLFWSNGTALGGLNSSFLVVHQSSFSLLKPNDAISDLITDAFVGDIIPVRISLKDAENNDILSNAVVSYNWTTGTSFFEEAALGIYETILDTSDLGSNGFYEILIESSKTGFFDYNLTLKINLGEETNVQRLQSDYNIELHANSTIKFRYYSLLDSEGIDGADIGVNITNPIHYNIINSPGGYYDIEFDTSFIDELGIYQLNFNFSATSFEPQTHIYQFEIIEQSVNITTYINNAEINQNSIIDVTYMEEINISTQAKALIDENLLTGGNFTWKYNSYEQSIDESAGFWYNTSIQIDTSIYVPGLNLISIQFEMDKYQTDIFYFQLFVYEQPVDLSVYINSQPISENEIFEIMYMESISVSVKAFATIEEDYINGALITWQGGNQEKILIEMGLDWYNSSIQVVPSNYTPGLNSIAIEFIKDNYQNEVFYFQLLVEEQDVDLSLYMNSEQISEDQLIEVMFKQNITISARAYGVIDMNYINYATISWNSDNFHKNLIECGSNWYNLSIVMSSVNFSSGVNSISIRFEKENYSTTYFSFQLLVKEQSVQLNVSINSQPILENALIELMFKENITIDAQAYALGEEFFLSGGNITLIGEKFSFNIPENISNPTWFSKNIIIDGAYFDLGINTLSVKFEQANYSDAYFSFQFFITAETVNLSIYVNSQEINPNTLITVTYYEDFLLSLRAITSAEQLLLDSGNAIFTIGSYNQGFTEYGNYWYNTTIECDPTNFNLGINSVYVRFQHPNYSSSTFYFQVLVNQIEMNVNTIGFQDTINSYSGDSLVIRINLTEYVSANYIENASVSYTWDFGLGNFEEVGGGVYEIRLAVPENVQGSFKVSLIISSDNPLYKAKQMSFFIVVSQRALPEFIFWIILSGLAIVIGVLGSLSIRSYVILPRKRKKKAKLLSKTQRFKDLQNIQAIVVIHKLSGIPLYAKSYSILEKQKKELFSGFIQAVATIGEEIVGKRATTEEVTDNDDEDKTRRILELDFKYFYCLICDRQDLRVVFILNDPASERLKTQISDLSLALTLQLSQEIENWDGSIDKFDLLMPPIISKYIELYFKEAFVLNNPAFIADMRKAAEFTSMETRILNVIYSMAKNKQNFHLNQILETIHEDNKDLVIVALESLIEKLIILPSKNKQ